MEILDKARMYFKLAIERKIKESQNNEDVVVLPGLLVASSALDVFVKDYKELSTKEFEFKYKINNGHVT